MGLVNDHPAGTNCHSMEMVDLGGYWLLFDDLHRVHD
jgi:hypothetical protein